MSMNLIDSGINAYSIVRLANIMLKCSNKMKKKKEEEVINTF